MSSTLAKQYTEYHEQFPFLTEENFYRINLLYYFVDYNNQNSYPTPFSRTESIFSVPHRSKTPLLTLLTPSSPFHIVDVGKNQKLLMYHDEFVDTVEGYEQTTYDLKQEEPFYFFVREVRGELVLKLNPIQLCDFFKNASGEMPCSFCFRNDMVSRFRNCTAKELLPRLLSDTESARLLPMVDEISLITGSYRSDDQYLQEVESYVKTLRSVVRPDCRIVVGSHEAKGQNVYERLKKAGVTTLAFPVESLDDIIRTKGMNNRKGRVPMKHIKEYVKQAIAVFGDDGVILRTVAGMGDRVSDEFRETVAELASYGQKGPLWNINIYMPFTHYHWRLVQQSDRIPITSLFSYCSTINESIPKDRFWNFKISP